jgi:hypothetical protein
VPNLLDETAYSIRINNTNLIPKYPILHDSNRLHRDTTLIKGIRYYFLNHE